MRRTLSVLVIAVLITFSGEVSAQKIIADTLTIETAIEKAIENNPEIQEKLKIIDALKAGVIQSGLLPNPEFSLEAENILGSNEFSGFKGSEITASVNQEVALTSRISKRKKVAELNVGLAEADLKIKRLEVISEIRKNFTDALALSELIEKNRELLNVSEEFVKNLELRVKAGKISPAEVSRARLILNSIEITIGELETEYNTVVFNLISIINDPGLSENVILKGELDSLINFPSPDSVIAALENNLLLQKLKEEQKKQSAIVEYEETKSIPPLNLGIGIRRINELSANTFLIQTSIPIPVFDRNQGAIQQSKIEVEQKRIEYEALKNILKQKLNMQLSKLKILLETVRKIKDESLPVARKAYEVIKKGNEVGRFTILDVLDAQRTLIELQNQYLNMNRQINKTVITIESFINRKIK